MRVKHSGRSRIRRGNWVGVGKTCQAAGLALVLLLPSTVPAAELVSLGALGNANGASGGVALSADANVVGFYSDATNLVIGDTNQVRDAFVRDRAAGRVERVSVSTAGIQGNKASQAAGGAPALSTDGQVVAFYSDATNLVDDDTNGQVDVFVRVRSSSTTERISVGAAGAQANGASVDPSISADGRFVAFQSQATNLVDGDTNGATDVFVRDRQSGTTERVCGAIQGNGASFSPAISADGNIVAFMSAASNLVAADSNGQLDIFICNRSSGVISRVSVATDGTQGNGGSILPAISADGLVVAFKSLADNLVAGDRNNVVDVFAHDTTSGTTERISANNLGGDANDFSFPPSVSHNGRYIAFGSFGTNIVPPDTNNSADVFVRDRVNGVSILVDVNSQGEQANGGTPDAPPAISDDGTIVAFVSFASNLDFTDRNGQPDVFTAPNPFFGPGSCPDGTCPSGELCVGGFCATPTPTQQPTKTPTVTKTPTPANTATPTPTFRPCMDDSDCQLDEHCRAGFCKKERPCDDTNPVIDRNACYDREACVNNTCECGGDCNVDGVVLVDEIARALLVLGGSRPLSQCLAADLNADGFVMGNEITLAVLNQSKGCAQEGRPLLFAHDRGGLVTLGISATKSDDGQQATVAVDMSGGGGEVATAQLDILFDPAVLDLGDTRVSCRKDARLVNQVLSATLPSTPEAPAGLQRLRLFVGDISDPIATFADGRIVTCTFQIRGGNAAGEATLGADGLNVGDAHGDVFGSQVVGASIAVPTPAIQPTPRTPCAGDCDGSGDVTGNEITIAVRILAGQAELSECVNADADGDGEVYVTDVTRAVLSLGRGCPR